MKVRKLLRTLRKDVKAVSPIIATLMLVLVSVAAAVSFYVWETGWQKDVTENTSGGSGVQSSITIGGSSTVYEFTAVAAQYYETSNPGYKVSYQAGGSGAGVQSVGGGLVDIGAASRALDQTEINSYPDLNRDGTKDFGKALVSHQIAWDAVVVVVPTANTHGLVSINESTLNAIYSMNGNKAGYTAPAWLPAGVDNKYQWTEIPTTQGSTLAFCTGAGDVTIYDREDEGGTEEVFSKQIIDTGKNYLEEAGITATHKFGNQLLAAAIAADANALSFMSYGIVGLSTSGLKQIPFRGDDDSTALTAGVANIKDATFDGSRPLIYITVGAPTGAVKAYLDYVLTPDYNQAICKKSDYISIYA